MKTKYKPRNKKFIFSRNRVANPQTESLKAKTWVSSRGSIEAPNPNQNPLLAPRNQKPPRPPKSPVWTAPLRYPDHPPRTSPFSSSGLYLLLRIRLLLPGSAPYPTTSSLAAGKSCRRVNPTLLSFALYFNWAFQTGLVKRDPFLQFFFSSLKPVFLENEYNLTQ